MQPWGILGPLGAYKGEPVSHHRDHTEHDMLTILKRIDKRIEKMALDFVPLTDKVTKIDNASDSVITLLQSIAQDIRDEAGNQTKLNELAANLDAKADALAAAVVANTPAENPGSGDQPTAAHRR